ncbi:MAG: hypothetical protein ACT4QG_22985 [Sporichthyaceae bacterium]
MLHELWDDHDEEGQWGYWTFCLAGPHGDDARAMLNPDARLTWTVEAATHFEAMTLYYEHQGWGTYTTINEPMPSYRELGWE